MDLGRARLDICVMDDSGTILEVLGALESMNGARFVHDALELAGWSVELADAQKVNGLAPLACRTDRIDARVLADPSRRDLVLRSDCRPRRPAAHASERAGGSISCGTARR